MITRLTTLLTAAIAIAAIAVGCGSDSDDSTSEGQSGGSSIATSSLDKAEFIKQASAACERERKPLVLEITAYLQNHESEGPEPVVIANMAKTVYMPAIEAEIAAIRELGAPEGDEDEVEAILAAEQAAIDEVKKLKKAKSLEEIESYFLKATDKFQAYGFVSCVNSA